MRRISVCAVLFLSSALGFGWQKPPYRGQTPFFARPMAIPGDASHQQEQSQNQGELREALRACAALLVAATSVSCPDAAQRKAQPQQQPPQPPANLQEKSGGQLADAERSPRIGPSVHRIALSRYLGPVSRRYRAREGTTGATATTCGEPPGKVWGQFAVPEQSPERSQKRPGTQRYGRGGHC
jgi:hypothetical protein